VPRVEELLREVTGQPVKVRLEQTAPPSTSGVASPQSANEPTGSPQASGQRQWAELLARTDDLKYMVDVFGAQPVRLDPDFGAAPVVVQEPTELVDSEEP